MDTRTGHIYETIEEARAAGVPDRFLVSGTREALENVRNQLVFTKGSFKRAVRDEHGRLVPA